VKQKIEIHQSEVERQFSCPYCGEKVSEENGACCGEVGHGEDMYLVREELYTLLEFDRTFRVVDDKQEVQGRECGCEKTCFCEPESVQDR
jgi:hypothetical protein